MWNLTAYQKSKPERCKITYCILGNNKGEIFFVDINNKMEFKTKIHFHSQPVTLIR